MGRMTPEKAALGLTANQLNPGDPQDALKFSEIVYQPGGGNRCNGKNWKYKGVRSQEELDAALARGWFRSLQEALDEAPTEAEVVQREIAKLKAEKQLDADMKELEELRKWKAEREAAANGEATKPIETATTSEFTPEELHSLYIDNGKDWKKVTELTGESRPWLKCKGLMQAETA